jgi:hypothetical protein
VVALNYLCGLGSEHTLKIFSVNPWFILDRISMDPSGVSDLGFMEDGIVNGSPSNPVFNNLGLEELILEDLNIPLTSGIFLGNHTLFPMSFLIGLTNGSTMSSLAGLEDGLEPIPGSSEGLFTSLGSKPGATNIVANWDTSQKDSGEDYPGALFSPS